MLTRKSVGKGAAQAAPDSDLIWQKFQERWRRVSYGDLGLRLLYDHLTPEQRQAFVTTGQFEVHGNSRKNLLGHNAGGPYIFYEGELSPRIQTSYGTRTFCIHPHQCEGITYADQVLAHKLMIESDEKHWRSVANLQ